MAIDLAEWTTGKFYVIVTKGVQNPTEDEPLIIPGDENEIGDNEYESVSSFPRKLLQESLESEGLGQSTSGFESPHEAKSPWKEAYYLPLEKMGGFYGYELPAPPNMGTGKSGGTLGMQGGLMILMFAVCYMLYMILKKRVCSFSIGWKDTDGGELELGEPRDA